MDLIDLPPAVQKLTGLGFLLEENETPDYRALGIGPDDIFALVDILQRTRDFWDEALEDEENPVFWTPVHAMHALGQLQAVEAIPSLLAALRLIESDLEEILQSEFPSTMCEMGPVAVPALTEYLLNPLNELWARIAVAEGLTQIGDQYPETRAEVVSILIRALEGYPREDLAFNGFMIQDLMELKALESIPLVEQAYADNRVDESIYGDWEDFQVGIGLLETRLTPDKRITPSLFYIETPPITELANYHPHAQPERKKTKKRSLQAAARKHAAALPKKATASKKAAASSKQAAASRKKNDKKKKK